MEDLLKLSEIPAVLRVSAMTARRMVKRGELPSLRIGRQYFIRRSDLEELVRAGERGPGETVTIALSVAGAINCVCTRMAAEAGGERSHELR